MVECEIPRDKCIDLSYLIEAAQRDINNMVSTVKEISGFPDLPGRDTLISNLNRAIERDEKSLSNAIETLKDCGCKDIGISVLFA